MSVRLPACVTRARRRYTRSRSQPSRQRRSESEREKRQRERIGNDKREKLWRFSFLFPFDLSPPPTPSPLHFQITHAHTHNSIFLHYTQGGMNIFFVKSTQDKGGKRKGTHNRERASLSLPPVSRKPKNPLCLLSLFLSLFPTHNFSLSLILRARAHCEYSLLKEEHRRR